MAEQMIRFYGFEPEEDIKIEYVGLRPGERLGEKLWSDDEIPVETSYNRILKVDRKTPLRTDIPTLVDKLRYICKFDPAHRECYRNSELLRKLLENAVPSLRDTDQIPDAAGGPVRAEPNAGKPAAEKTAKEPHATLSWSSAVAFRPAGKSRQSVRGK
jgi:hypothetical protein